VGTLLQVAQIIALICISVLCVYLITTVLRLRETFESFNKHFSELSEKTIPVLSNLEEITGRTKSIISHLEEQVRSVKLSVESLQDIVEDIKLFERRLERILEQPVVRTVELVNELVSGIGSVLSIVGLHRKK
jgi:uncharacterized protein YoxC